MLLFAALSLLLAGEPAAASPESALLGQWESVTRTAAGVGNILEFLPDGRVTQVSATMAEADYRVDGEWLKMSWKDRTSGKTSEAEAQIEVEGSDRLVEKLGEKGNQTVSERVGEPVPGGSPILGQWCSPFLGIFSSYREFTPTRVYTRMPVVTLRGRYIAGTDALTVQMEGQPSGQYPYRIENGLLVIKSRDGSEKQYKRPETSLLRGY